MKHQFCGYYDLCPWSPDGKHFIKMEADFADREPLEGEKLRILVDDKVVAETTTWNWQQGCRARWVNNEIITYNDKTWEYQLDIKTGKKFIVNNLEHDYYILPDGYNYKPSKKPEGEFVLFQSRGAVLYRKEDGKQTLRLRGKDIYLDAHVSHFNWRNKDEIIFFGKLFNPSRKLIPRFLLNIIRKMRGKIKQTISQQGYYLFNLKTKKLTKIGWGLLTENGHPSFCPTNEDLFVSDTYVINGFRTLFTYNIKTNRYKEIAKFPSNGDIEDSPMRADLHPKWSRDGRWIAVDVMRSGIRSVEIYDSIVSTYIKSE